MAEQLWLGLCHSSKHLLGFKPQEYLPLINAASQHSPTAQTAAHGRCELLILPSPLSYTMLHYKTMRGSRDGKEAEVSLLTQVWLWAQRPGVEAIPCPLPRPIPQPHHIQSGAMTHQGIKETNSLSLKSYYL